MEKVFEAIQNVLGKALTFISSRRAWVLGALAALLTLLGFVGLNSDLASEIVAATGGVADQTVVVVAALAILVERLGVLIGLVVVAVKLMTSYNTRPPVMEDWREDHVVVPVDPIIVNAEVVNLDSAPKG